MTSSDPAQPASRGRSLRPSSILRAEGLLVLAAAVIAYASTSASWWLFAVLLLAPDVGLLGYLAGPRVGAATYNVTHTLVVPLAAGIVGFAVSSVGVVAPASIWIAHIGMDRLAGYGLKYPDNAKRTHLQRLD